MIKNLTKALLFLLVLLLDLSASNYKWSAKSDKKTAYVNEVIILTYICEFNDASELYTIDFDPVQDNKEFTLKLLKESQVVKDSKRVNSYEFLAYVKRAGSISFDFDVLMKKTTQASIDSTTNGHYDDSKSESFVLTPLKLSPLIVNIKVAPSKLVGEFTLKVQQDSPELTPYQPYNLEIEIEGIGNFSTLSPVDFNIEGVKVFTQSPVLKSKLTKNGEKGVWNQQFAFMSEHSFTLPKISIEYFDLKTASLKRLTSKAITINIHENLNNPEKIYPIEEKKESIYKKEYLYYLLIFILGFLVAKIKHNPSKPQKQDEKLFESCIKETTSLEKLCFLLVNRDAQKYKKIISLIESKEITSLQKAKKLCLQLQSEK